MRPIITVSMTALALAVLAQAASASEFHAAPNATYLVDLDTANGNYSVWRQQDIASLTGLRATIAVHRLADDPHWAPVITFSVLSGEQRVALQFVSFDRKSPLHAQLLQPGAAGNAFNTALPETLAVDEKASIAVDWTADGWVVFTVNDHEVARARLAAAATSVEIGCSTAELEVNPLKLGRTTP